MYTLRLTMMTLYFSWIYSPSLAQISIVRAPQNEALVQTGSVTLQCKVEQKDDLTQYLGWDECITKDDGTCRRISNDNKILYSDLGGDPIREARYSVSNPENKQYNLQISGTLPEDAGKYRCVSPYDIDLFKTSEIIVLESEPSCRRNTSNEVVEGDYVKMTCELTYHGRWSPQMNWKVNGRQYSGNIIDETVDTQIKQSIVIHSQPDNDGDVFGMDTNFAVPTDVEESEASNRPAYEHSHSFDVLTVFYAPYSISTSPDKGSYQPGDTVSCSAIAKPSAEYVWIDTNTTEIISESSVLTITESMLGSQIFLCRAYNQYGNDTIQLEFNVYSGVSLSTAAIAGIVSAAIIIVIVIIILAICLPMRNKQLKEKQANETRPNVVPGTDVIRTPGPQPFDNKPVLNNEMARYPDEKVGHDPGQYDPYGSGPYDLESPPYNEYDDVEERKKRNVENLTYADLALEDVPRSRKPIQFGIDMTEYAEIQRV